MLAALAFGLLSTTANAVVLYDPHITLYNPNGKFAGTVRRYSNGATQSWDARGRPLYHSYGR